jgi:hypothetical protein
MADRILRYFKPSPGQVCPVFFGLDIKISLEKPTAVPFADCPVVEIRVGAGATQKLLANSTEP